MFRLIFPTQMLMYLIYKCNSSVIIIVQHPLSSLIHSNYLMVLPEKVNSLTDNESWDLGISQNPDCFLPLEMYNGNHQTCGGVVRIYTRIFCIFFYPTNTSDGSL